MSSISPIREQRELDPGFDLPPPADAWDGSGWPQTSEGVERLVKAWVDPLVRYAFRRLGNVADAEDVVQEVFVRAFADCSKRSKISSAVPYLYRMTANACTDALRRRRPVEVPLDDINAGAIPDIQPSPRESAVRAEELARVETLLARLPAKQAEAIRLRVFDGLRLHEIAEALGTRRNTVSARLRYGFANFAKSLRKGRDRTMNCANFNEYLDGLLTADPGAAPPAEVLEHAGACSRCAREYSAAKQALSSIQLSYTLRASDGLKERIMNQVIESGKTTSAGAGYQRRPLGLGWRAAMAAAAMAALWLFVTLGYNHFAAREGKAPLTAFGVLARATEVMTGMKTVHIKARMRTLPRDNFELILPDQPFVPHDIWRVLGNPGQWRVEKPGRVIVMDGKSSLMIIGQNESAPRVAKGGVGTGMVEWLRPLLDVDTLFERETALAKREGSEVTIATQPGPGGAKVILTIKAKAQGDFSQSDYLKNKLIICSDNTRVYQFDAKTMRLETMQVLINMKGAGISVFEIDSIEYDKPIDPALFALEVPKDATDLMAGRVNKTGVDTSAMTPKQAAQAFFQACADENWEAARPFYGVEMDRPDMRQYLGKLKILSLGEPFKSGLFGGWFVPYEIQLRNGETKKWNLAIRNDTRNKQWMVDGGI